MESLSSVRTIMGIAQDILSAVETASRNKSRCDKVAKRVRCIKDILEEQDDGTTTDAATRSLLDRLEEALGRALQVVRRCQRCRFLRSVVIVVAGGRMADPLDGVEGDIDRCILDLAVANSIRMARLEALVRQHAVALAAAGTEDDSEEDYENKSKKGSAEGGVSDKKADDLQVPLPAVVPTAEMDHDSTTATEEMAAIGVPVCTVTAAAHEDQREMVPPPPSYGYWYGYRSYYGYWPSHGCACDSWDGHAGGGPSDAAFYHNQYASCPSMFSDDNPNSCSIL